ncbi:MBL fold metallo-hydrolase [Oceanirhabdus sp. W0125-5]|uniref:MBL fold metallo-hydrolase n=1 Tax=Oceanirhabdus sp. W0125-5 TaxID=2999116 RepID=UPI0022F2C0A2|nr:MBL fold metallo-hydrolase [Oceanirhabdus sp. W0125-5]WBW99102.1 MBL fold metallo-hydrolase [Oceanirhabdus sp. W0125-5]
MNIKSKGLKILFWGFLVMSLLASSTATAMGSTKDNESKVLYKLKDWTKVSKHVYVSTGTMNSVNMVLVVYGDKATLVDLGYNEAEGLRIKEFIEKEKLTLENIIVTHLHGDHTGNYGKFKVDDGHFFTPRNTTDGQIIEMGEAKLKIVKTPGHADDLHDSVELTNENLLIAGDVVVTNVGSNLKFGGSYHTLIETLEKIKNNNYDLIIPGHGDIIDAEFAINNQLSYLKNLYSKVKSVYRKMKLPTTLDKLKNSLYENIKIQDCVLDMSVINTEEPDRFHKGNIDNILNLQAMESYLSGHWEDEAKKTPRNETFVFPSLDGLDITADLYLIDNTSPIILLFHRARWSRGEYLEIAPRLNELGYNVMAIDARSGASINGVDNKTVLRALENGLAHTHPDALVDIEAAIQYAHEELGYEDIITWGSSYSASLVLAISQKYSDNVRAVLAFAPGEYFKIENKSIAKYAKELQLPVFITGSKPEEQWYRPLYEAISSKDKVCFIPESQGYHGSQALWKSSNDNDSYWNAVKTFLKSLKLK